MRGCGRGPVHGCEVRVQLGLTEHGAREHRLGGGRPDFPGFWPALLLALRPRAELSFIKTNARDSVMPSSIWSCPFGRPCHVQNTQAFRAQAA